MKHFLIALSVLLCISISSFATSTDDVGIANSNLTCVLDDNEYKFKIDYNLPLRQTRIKLSKALIFEDYLHQQIRQENEKYDQLVAEKMHSDKRTKGISRRLSQQYQKTMDLVSAAESLSKYISWLRS